MARIRRIHERDDMSRSVGVLDSAQGKAQRALRVRINAARVRKGKPVLHIANDRILTKADVAKEVAR